MIAKLVTHAGTRQAAIDLQAEALDAFVIDGVGHNIPFLAALMQHPRWREGRLSTGFIAEEYAGGFKTRTPQGEELDMLAAVAVAHRSLAQYAPARDHATRWPGRRCASRPAASPMSAARWSPRAWRARLGHPAKVTLVDAKGIRRTTLDVDADWWPGNPLWRGQVGKRPVAVQVRPILNGYELVYRGISAKAYVYTEREAALAGLMPEKACARHLQAAAVPDAGAVEGDPRRAGPAR